MARPRKNAIDTSQKPDTEQMQSEMVNASPLSAIAQNEADMIDAHIMMQKAQEEMPKAIGTKEVMRFTEILNKYKSGKANLERKLIANEEFWKLRQWRYSDIAEKGEYTPATSWLWSCIQSRYSDAMDSYPTCNFLPRQEDDKDEARRLSKIIPVVLQQNKYEETYSDIAWYLLKQGGCAQGIFWDASAHNGLGDIKIKKIDILNLFWQPGITNIQDSAYVFVTELVDNDIIENKYPQTKGKLSSGKTVNVAKYIYDDNLDTTNKSVVVDVYYKKQMGSNRTLQYAKYVNDIVLYATENEVTPPTSTQVDPMTGMPLIIPTGKSMAESGLYEHGMYPFVVTSLYPIEGSLIGYGLTDIAKDAQIQIDVMNRAIVENTVVNAKPRFFIRNDGSVNEDEMRNTNNSFVHCEGNVDDTNIRPIVTTQINATYVNELQRKIEEIKFVTSNQDVQNGGTPSGVTSGSAIAALQEASGKNARSSNLVFHRAFREVCEQVVELIRQFYDVPRTFRIAPDEFTNYSNNGLVAQQQNINGQDMGLRLPVFDIEITSEKASPYKRMERNELAINFYNLGFFNAQMADQALACLEMMDFDKKDDVIKIVQQNSMTQQLLLQFEQIALQLAQKHEPQMVESIAQAVMMAGQETGQPMPSQMAVEGGGDINLDGKTEHPFAERARQQAQSSTQAE